MNKLFEKLKPVLEKKIQEAINEIDQEIDLSKIDAETFPWLGKYSFDIMADAVICVLRGMQDTQYYIESEK